MKDMPKVRRTSYPTSMSSSSSENEDRISELPESIMVEILNLLPITDAVRSSLLSKKWLYVWTLIPDLIFDICGTTIQTSECFVKFVNKTIFFHNCPKIDCFAVGMRYTHEFQSIVDAWVRFAAIRRVQTFSLAFPLENSYVELSTGDTVVGSFPYVLPRHLYTNDTIEDMNLCGCSIAHNPLVNWKSLISLYIADTLLKNDMIQSIVRGSPSLNCLQVQDCWGFSAFDVTCNTSLKTLVITGIGCECEAPPMLDIYAPYVESLTLTGYFQSVKCRVLSVSSSLNDAELSFYFDMYDDGVEEYTEYQLMLIKLLQCLSHSAILTIGNWCLKVLSMKMAKNTSFPYLSCKSLILESYLGKFEQSGIVTLLEVSKKLEKLLVEKFCSSQVDFHPPLACFSHGIEELCWMSQKDLKQPLQELKRVKLFNNKVRHKCHVGTVNAFAQYLHKNAPHLQKITIFGRTSVLKC